MATAPIARAPASTADLLLWLIKGVMAASLRQRSTAGIRQISNRRSSRQDLAITAVIPASRRLHLAAKAKIYKTSTGYPQRRPRPASARWPRRWNGEPERALLRQLPDRQRGRRYRRQRRAQLGRADLTELDQVTGRIATGEVSAGWPRPRPTGMSSAPPRSRACLAHGRPVHDAGGRAEPDLQQQAVPARNHLHLSDLRPSNTLNEVKDYITWRRRIVDDLWLQGHQSANTRGNNVNWRN